MEGLVVVIEIVWAVLCLILFFKIWGACNAIKRLADKYAPESEMDKIREKNKRNKRKSASLETRDEIENWLKKGDTD